MLLPCAVVQHFHNVSGLQQFEGAVGDIDGGSKVSAIGYNMDASLHQQTHHVVHHSAFRQRESDCRMSDILTNQ